LSETEVSYQSPEFNKTVEKVTDKKSPLEIKGFKASKQVE